MEFLSYPQRTGGHIDYVLVWGASEDSGAGESSGDGSAEALDDSLEAFRVRIDSLLEQSGSEAEKRLLV